MNDAARSVLLVGATGLVGRECLRLLLADPEVIHLVVATRRALPIDVPATKLEVRVVDFDRLHGHPDLFAVDQIVCALGTTMRRAGSREGFRAVDFDLPLRIARLGLAHGARHFLLVSSVGADARSRAFYTRVKGELEDAIRALGYPSVTIVRPSLLRGKRVERRLGERVALRVMRFAPRKWKPIGASAVAEALVRAARRDAPGVRVIESAELHEATAGA